MPPAKLKEPQENETESDNGGRRCGFIVAAVTGGVGGMEVGVKTAEQPFVYEEPT